MSPNVHCITLFLLRLEIETKNIFSIHFHCKLLASTKLPLFTLITLQFCSNTSKQHTKLNTRAVPNIRFVFTSVSNSDTNSLFVFERIVHPKTNTNSMTLTRPRRDERTVGSCNWYPTPGTTSNHCDLAPPPHCNLIRLRWCGGGPSGTALMALLQWWYVN